MNIWGSVSIVVLMALLLNGCTNQKQQERQEAPQMPPTEMVQQDQSNMVAGIEWTVPQHWKEQPQRQMRIATYTIPSAEGDADEGECAVFYFGNNQGGGIDMNIDRWAAQFENSPKPDRSSKEMNGIKVTFVTIDGTYLAPSGPMMQSQGKKPDYRLLGAIVEVPDGLVFFKFTGPKKTIAAAESEFTSLIQSIKKN